MFQEPDKLGRIAGDDRFHARFHLRERVGIGHEGFADAPFHGRLARLRREGLFKDARIRHARLIARSAAIG
jgi:hypothetical protein